MSKSSVSTKDYAMWLIPLLAAALLANAPTITSRHPFEFRCECPTIVTYEQHGRYKSPTYTRSHNKEGPNAWE